MLSNYARLDGRKKLPVGGKKVEIILLVADDPVKCMILYSPAFHFVYIDSRIVISWYGSKGKSQMEKMIVTEARKAGSTKTRKRRKGMDSILMKPNIGQDLQDFNDLYYCLISNQFPIKFQSCRVSQHGHIKFIYTSYIE